MEQHGLPTQGRSDAMLTRMLRDRWIAEAYANLWTHTDGDPEHAWCRTCGFRAKLKWVNLRSTSRHVESQRHQESLAGMWQEEGHHRYLGVGTWLSPVLEPTTALPEEPHPGYGDWALDDDGYPKPLRPRERHAGWEVERLERTTPLEVPEWQQLSAQRLALRMDLVNERGRDPEEVNKAMMERVLPPFCDYLAGLNRTE